ncbi:MAG TPA: 2-phospho-L-lactate transferase CofD family protein, partial [Chloroflexota bacterium]|nr:2-phospho-L-lactate transferase CofD family protein [Chloroflexota bacterium]
MLAVQGQILPSTLEDVVLAAELRDKSTVHGESNMHQDHASGDVDLQGRAPIERVFLVPAHAVGYPEAVQALLDADIVVVGPGSLYTSVLPNLLVKDIARALAASAAYKVFV